MTDIRENILARLVAIIATLPNLKSSHRNNVDIPEELLPAAAVMDENEETSEIQDMSMHQSLKPIAVRMMPEIILIATESDQAGSALTAMRFELVRRVLTDTELNEQLVKTFRSGNGAIRYIGCQTGVGWMRSLHAAMRLQFTIKYFLKPEDLL